MLLAAPRATEERVAVAVWETPSKVKVGVPV
jgi:hypothetical protein